MDADEAKGRLEEITGSIDHEPSLVAKAKELLSEWNDERIISKAPE
jgi:hypothetical protein